MSGGFSPLSPSAVSVGFAPRSGILAPNGAYFYAITAQSSSPFHSLIYQYSVGSGGQLTPLSPAFFDLGAVTNANFLVIHPSGNFLYALGSNTVYQLAIGAGGVLSFLTPSTISAPGGQFNAAIDPGGSNLYVIANSTSSFIQHLTIGVGGHLTDVAGTTVGSYSSGIVVSPNGQNIYVSDDTDGRIYQLAIGSFGTPSPLSPASVAAGTFLTGISITPSGDFVYATDDNNNVVYQFSVGAGGLLSPLSPASVPTGASPEALVISADGAYLYTSNVGDETIGQYSIGGAGQVVPLSSPTVSTGNSVNSLSTGGGGPFLYAAAFGETNVYQYGPSSGPPTVIVPNVLGLQQSDAQAAIIAATLTVGATSTQPSLTATPGTVLGQSPLGGATASPGDPVALIVSSGFVTVPDIVGDAASVANSTLLALGLSAGSISNTISADTPYGDVVSQSPAAGTHVIAGSFVSYVISVPGSGFNVDDTVISQYANSPTLLQLIHNMEAYIDPATNFANFYQFVWNVDTAVGFGLDIWGKIVGVSRLLKIVGPQDFVGFFNADVPYDWETMSFGTFYTGAANTQSYLLQDDAYRTLILTKALANIVATTAPAMNQLLRNLFPGRGNCFVVDLGGMAMQFVFQFPLTPVEFAILTQSGALPHPAGVAFNVVVLPTTEYTTFAEFGPTALPLSVGTLYLPA